MQYLHQDNQPYFPNQLEEPIFQEETKQRSQREEQSEVAGDLLEALVILAVQVQEQGLRQDVRNLEVVAEEVVACRNYDNQEEIHGG